MDQMKHWIITSGVQIIIFLQLNAIFDDRGRFTYNSMKIIIPLSLCFITRPITLVCCVRETIYIICGMI